LEKRKGRGEKVTNSISVMFLSREIRAYFFTSRHVMKRRGKEKS